MGLAVRPPDVLGVREPALHALREYAWPGNVRELINVVERAVVLCRGSWIDRDVLPEEIADPGAGARPDLASASGRGPAPCGWLGLLDEPLPQARRKLVDGFERDYLERLLRDTGGSLAEAGRRAGVDPRTIYNKMRRFGMNKEDFRARDPVARAS